MVGKKVSGYDDAGHEIMFADYDYSNGVWIANVMKISSWVEAKEVTVGYFWEINSWVPSEMLVVEYDESHQKLSSIYQWEEDTWIPGNGQR